MGISSRRLISVCVVILAAVPAAAGVANAAPVQIGVKTTPAVEEVPGAGSGTLLAWAQGVPANLFVQTDAGQPAIRVNPRHTEGWPGGFDGTTLIYQQVHKASSDIQLWDVATHERSVPPGVNTPGWEWHPTMSGDWILYGKTHFFPRRSRVLLTNIRTEQTITLADVKGNADPGQVNGNWAVWHRCVDRLCSVYRYDIATGERIQAPPTHVGRQQRYASVTSTGTVYFMHSGSACGRNAKLVEWVPGQPLQVLIAFLPGVQVTSTTQAALDPVTGTDVYFDKHTCGQQVYDIFKVVVP